MPLQTARVGTSATPQTMGYETYYYALRLSGGDVLRVAQDAETVWSIYDATIPAIVLSCVALMLAAAVLAALLTKALVQPVLNMTEDLDHIQENVPYRELIPFAESIHSDRILRENNEKMRQEFTANVSHELKTPLTSISGYAELIETGIAKPEDVPDFGRKIHSEATRMIQLVNDILQLSKLDTVSETGDCPGDGNGRPFGGCQGVRRAPEIERPPCVYLPDLSGRERPGAWQPRAAG